MKKTVLVSLATTVLAICAGLAQSQAPSAPRPTKVMVSPPATKEGQLLLWIDQEPIIVRGTNVTIEWRIATTGYEFPDNGIVFVDKEAADEFVKCGPIAKRQAFQCVDRNTAPRGFKYQINVRGIGGKPSPRPLDPWVVNDR